LEYLIYAGAAVLGFIFRYQLGMTQACKVIGVEISDSGSNTGFQNAITPPSSTNLTLITWFVIAALLIYSVVAFDWGVFGIALATFGVVSVIVGSAVVPKADSTYFLFRVYRSMANRYADFPKNGDSVRAEAMKELIDRVEAVYGDNLK
jgi:hypothetical protein